AEIERTDVAQITLNEGLAWLKTLKKRHEELITLRDGNAHRERRFYGASADKEIVKEPVYDVKALDKSVTRVAREIRLLGIVLVVGFDNRLRVGGVDIARSAVPRACRVVGKPRGCAQSSGRKPMK